MNAKTRATVYSNVMQIVTVGAALTPLVNGVTKENISQCFSLLEMSGVDPRFFCFTFASTLKEDVYTVSGGWEKVTRPFHNGELEDSLSGKFANSTALDDVIFQNADPGSFEETHP